MPAIVVISAWVFQEGFFLREELRLAEPKTIQNTKYMALTKISICAKLATAYMLSKIAKEEDS